LTVIKLEEFIYCLKANGLEKIGSNEEEAKGYVSEKVGYSSKIKE
jgi:hypothetical protein